MQDTGVVQAYITQFVDQHHGSRPQPLACTALWLQQAVQQGRLAAAQESGNDCYRYFAAHDWPSASDGDGEFIKIKKRRVARRHAKRKSRVSRNLPAVRLVERRVGKW